MWIWKIHLFDGKPILYIPFGASKPSLVPIQNNYNKYILLMLLYRKWYRTEENIPCPPLNSTQATVPSEIAFDPRVSNSCFSSSLTASILIEFIGEYFATLLSAFSDRTKLSTRSCALILVNYKM